MVKHWSEQEGVGTLKPTSEMKVEPIDLYPKETIEHMVDQLIKLNQEYNRPNGYGNVSYRTEIDKAMKTLNVALEQALTFRLIQNKINE